MKRIAVVGPGGAGKSTFARELGQRTDLPVIHLDHHFWKPGWIETSRDEWQRRQAELLAGDRWIADGNYGGTFDERFARADTVIIISRSRLACVAAAFGRSARNHGKAVQADGCFERFDPAFYLWIWNYERDSRPRLNDAPARHEHLDVIELRSRAELNQFLKRIVTR